MKLYIITCSLILLFLIPVSCERHDVEINAIEYQLMSTNENISSFRALVDVLQKRYFITSVTELKGGYTLSFSDGSKINLKDGRDGKVAPILNVRFYNGKYYWTQTINGQTEWLTDSNGNLITATGENAVTPLLKVDSDGYYLGFLDKYGNRVKASSEVTTSMFYSMEIWESEFRIVLNDGTEFIIPIGELFPDKSVDLGLSVKWSSINYGAIYSSDIGGLYLWGDVDDSGIVLHYYAPYESYISGGEYDIVRANWGELWRMPNRNDMKELISDCVWTLVTVNGINGTRATASNGNSIFFPNTGIERPLSSSNSTTELTYIENGCYWLGESDLTNHGIMGYSLYLIKGVPVNYMSNGGLLKLAIRPVMVSGTVT